MALAVVCGNRYYSPYLFLCFLEGFLQVFEMRGKYYRGGQSGLEFAYL